jgi:hypothetical protein
MTNQMPGSDSETQGKDTSALNSLGTSEVLGDSDSNDNGVPENNKNVLN